MATQNSGWTLQSFESFCVEFPLENYSSRVYYDVDNIDYEYVTITPDEFDIPVNTLDQLNSRFKEK